MKKFILLLIIPFLSFGQACNFANSKDVSDICDYVRGNSFMSDRDAENSLEKILKATKSKQRFAIKECSNISNVVATTYNGINYILYDKEFMDIIARGNTSKLSILAHEIGHHINEHTLSAPKSLEENRKWELEADEYSGYVMCLLGASLKEAKAAINEFVPEFDDSYSTHPTKSKRLKAIEKGYNKAKKDSKNDDYKHTTLTAKDYFYKAYNNESDLQYKIDNYTKCLKIDPNYVPAYVNRGLTYQQLGNHNDAIADYTIAVIIDPDYVVAYVNRGAILGELGMHNDAIADLTRAIRIDPEKFNAYFNRGLAYAKLGNHNDAIADYTRAIRIYPGDARTYFNRGLVYTQLGNRNDAIADYTRAIRIDPDIADAYLLRGAEKEIAGLPYCSDYKRACDLGQEKSCERYSKQCRGSTNKNTNEEYEPNRNYNYDPQSRD